MEKETVKTYDDVLESIAVFNKSLEKSKRFRDQVRFFQSWYYVPELDAVGPSKFVRYKGMTGFDYIRTYSALDGRVAEPVLAKWFVRLEDNSPEAVWVRQRVDQLLGHYGKTVGNMAKFRMEYRKARGNNPTSKRSRSKPGRRGGSGAGWYLARILNLISGRSKGFSRPD